MLIVESDTEQVDQIQDRLGIGYTRRGGVIYGIWGETETGQREKGNDAADTGGAAVCDQTDRFPVGEWCPLTGYSHSEKIVGDSGDFAG